MLLLAGAESTSLACVYTLSFLSVMALFALGNILLKVNRARLPSPPRSSWFAVVVGIGAILAALVGNTLLALSKNRTDLLIFLTYFGSAMTVLTIMLCRISLLKATLFDELKTLSNVQLEVEQCPIGNAQLEADQQCPAGG